MFFTLYVSLSAELLMQNYSCVHVYVKRNINSFLLQCSFSNLIQKFKMPGSHILLDNLIKRNHKEIFHLKTILYSEPYCWIFINGHLSQSYPSWLRMIKMNEHYFPMSGNLFFFSCSLLFKTLKGK